MHNGSIVFRSRRLCFRRRSLYSLTVLGQALVNNTVRSTTQIVRNTETVSNWTGPWAEHFIWTSERTDIIHVSCGYYYAESQTLLNLVTLFNDLFFSLLASNPIMYLTRSNLLYKSPLFFPFSPLFFLYLHKSATNKLPS